MVFFATGTGRAKLIGEGELSLSVLSLFNKTIRVKILQNGGSLGLRSIPVSELIHETLLLPEATPQLQRAMAETEVAATLPQGKGRLISGMLAFSQGERTLTTLAIRARDWNTSTKQLVPASLALMSVWDRLLIPSTLPEPVLHKQKWVIAAAELSDGILLFLRQGSMAAYPKFIPKKDSFAEQRIRRVILSLSRQVNEPGLEFQILSSARIRKLFPADFQSRAVWYQLRPVFLRALNSLPSSTEAQGVFVEAAAAALIQSLGQSNSQVILRETVSEYREAPTWQSSLPAALLILALGAAANRGITDSMLSRGISRVDEEMKSQFQRVLPGRRMVSPLLQLNRAIEAGRAREGPKIGTLKLAGVMSSIPDQITLSELELDEGVIRFRGETEDIATLQTMKESITGIMGNGWTVRMQTEVNRQEILFQTLVSRDNDELSPEA